MRTRLTTWNALLLFGAASALSAEDRTKPQVPTPITANIRLTGVMHLRDATPKAYLMVAEPGRAPEWVTLARGEKSGCLEIVEIDAPRGKVTLRYREVPMTVSFSGQSVAEPVLGDAERKFVLEHTRSGAELERRQVAEGLRERAEAELRAAATVEESP